jgi:hypothetical protein
MRKFALSVAFIVVSAVMVIPAAIVIFVGAFAMAPIGKRADECYNGFLPENV